MKRNILIWLATVIGIILLGTVLIILSYLVNSDRLSENFAISQQQMKEKGEYERLDEFATSTLDNFTDSLMLLTASYRGDEGLLDSAMSNYRLEETGKDPYYTMIGNMDKDKINVTSYSRYWHGYLVILRPLLSFLDYSQIRMLNSIVQVILLVLLFVLMCKRKIGIFIIPFLAAYITINPITIAYSLQYSTVWYITMISMIVYLIFKNKIIEKKLHYILFTIVGMLTSYMDLLTYPISTLGMLMILVLITEELEFKEAIKRVLICGISWTTGYGIMWAAKWFIASMILNKNVFESANEAIQSRSSNILNSGKEIQRGIVLNNIFIRYDNVVTKLAIWINIIASILLFIFSKFKSKIFSRFQNIKFLEKVMNYRKSEVKDDKRNAKMRYSKNNKYSDKENKGFITIINSLPVLAMSLMPILWYYALTNHSYVHTFFTFRTLVVFWFALFATLFKIAKDLTKNKV